MHTPARKNENPPAKRTGSANEFVGPHAGKRNLRSYSYIYMKDVTPRNLAAFAVLATASAVLAAQAKPAASPQEGAFLPGQAVADVLREVGGADLAFVPARSLGATFDGANLASLVLFPTDDVVVVKLTGREVRQALERSVALYPQPNSSFLQVSGLQVEFSMAGAPESRVLNVSANGGALDENRGYTVAMPGSLGRGGSGYFKIWDKSKIERTVPGATLESILKGRRYVASSPRWLPRP